MSQLEKFIQLRDLLLEHHNLDLYSQSDRIIDKTDDTIVAYLYETRYPTDAYMQEIVDLCLNYLTS